MKVNDFTDRHLTETSKNISSDLEISTNGIEKLLKNLKQDKAAGLDKIRPLVLRELSEQIAPLLQVIYTVSMQTGRMPKDWTSANVAPLYKKGDKSDAAINRPISLTCIAWKRMEHIVASNLVRFLDSNNLLYVLQLVSQLEDLDRTASIRKQTN